MTNLQHSSRFAFAVAALCAAVGMSASALQYPSGYWTSENAIDMLSCCPGEDSSTQARFVWHTNPDSTCEFLYRKAGASAETTVVPTSEKHKSESWPQAFSVYKSSAQGTNYVNYARHTVELSGLESGTDYEYRVKVNGSYSATQRFRTAGTSGELNFLWMSDVHALRTEHAKMGCVGTLVTNAQNMVKSSGGLDFILFSGDFTKFGMRYDCWQEWNGNVALSDYMLAMCSGNKEYYSFPKASLSGKDRLRDGWFLSMRNNPDNGADGIGGSYWFIRDSVMFVSIDSLIGEASSYMNSTVVSEALKRQTNWFDRVVSEQETKKSFQYLVVFQHYPCFTYQTDDDGDPSGFKYGDGKYSKWSALFDKHKVDFVLGSDHHNYCRSKQLRSGKVDSQGVVYLTSPEIGKSIYGPTIETEISSLSTAGQNPSDAPDNTKIEGLMAAVSYGNESTGAILFSVNQSKMKMRYICKTSGSVYDSVEVAAKRDPVSHGTSSGTGDDPVGFNSTPHSRYRFAVDAPRSDDWCMQLSEIQLLDAEGHVIPSSEFTNAYDSTTLPADGSDPFPDGEEPENAVDGSTATKWLDWRAGLAESDETRKAVWLEFRFTTPTAVLGYRWFTANDSPSRTPVSWTLSYSDDNGANWVAIDKVVDYDTTTDFNALAYSKGIEYVSEYPPTTAGGTYYALCVGVDLYSDNPGCSTLSCCKPDVNNVLSACTNSTKGLWHPDNCYKICDYDATLSAVRKKFQNLAGKAQSGDTVLYYQSSHGGGSKSAYLCMTDGDYKDTYFADDLALFKTGVRVIVMLDACHSGGMFKGDGDPTPWNFAANVEARMAEIKEEMQAKGIKASGGPSIGWVTACDYNQLSYGGSSGSTFTKAMVNNWKSAKSIDTNGDGYNDFLEIFNASESAATSYDDEEGWTYPQKTNDAVLASVAAWEVTYHPPASNVWTGLGGNGNFSNGANWESGSAPVAGVPLDFTRLSTNATLNADIPNVAFPTAVFGSGIVTIDGALNLSALTNATTLAVGESGTLTLSEGVVSGSAGYFLYGNKGRVNVTGTFYFDTASGDKRVIAQATESTSQGVFYFNHAYAFGGNRAYLNMGQETDGNPDLDGSTPRDHTHFVIGAGGLTSDNASYAVVRKWATVLRSAADYAIGRRTSGATDPAIAISSNYACTLYLDTADEANATVGRTVTVAGQIQSSSYIKVVAMGPGEVKFTDTSTPNNLFSRGLLATNGVTVSVAAGARPGAGDVDIADGATFSMTGSSSGSVAVGGTLKLAAGSTVSFNGLGNGVVPLTVGSLSASVTDGRKPSISVDCTGLDAGLYPLVRSTSALPTDAAGSLALQVTGVEAYQASLEKSGNDICLRIRSNCEWTGGAGNGDMADPANWQDGVVPADASDVAKLDLSAATSLAGNVAVADGTTLVLPDAGAPLSITGDFAAGGEGETVNVQLGDGSSTLARGCYVLMEAKSIAGVENLVLKNDIAAKSADGYEFAVYGGEGNYRLALFVRMDPPAEWVNESKETQELTGKWMVPVTYDSNGWAEIDGANSFTAQPASTGRVVTVEMTARLSGGTADDGRSLDGVKAGIRIGTNGTDAVFQLYTSNDVSQVCWLDVAAEGVTPTEEGADYGVKFVMDETNRTYTAAVSNATSGAYVPLKAKSGGSAVFNFAIAGESAAVSQFDFVGDGRIKSIIGTCTDAILLFSVNDEVYLADGGEPIRLSAAQAEWLNGIVGSGSGDHDAVVAALRSVGSGAIGDACLLNLDITQKGWGWTFETTSFAVVDKAGGEREITVGVRLVRDHAVQKDGKSAPINGTLALHSYDLASKSLGDAISEEVTLTNETFSDGDDATITFTPSDDGKFLKAKIKAK